MLVQRVYIYKKLDQKSKGGYDIILHPLNPEELDVLRGTPRIDFLKAIKIGE